MLRNQMRIWVPEEEEDAATDEEDTERAKLDRAMQKAASRPPPRAPWEYVSADELLAAPSEEKALSALVARLPLPRAERLRSSTEAGGDEDEQTDAVLAAMLEPFCDETVRRELRARRALAQGDPVRASAASGVRTADPELFALNTQLDTCSRMRREIVVALTAEDYARAAELQVFTRRIPSVHMLSPPHAPRGPIMSSPIALAPDVTSPQEALVGETDYLDELLEETPAQSAFTTSAVEVAAAVVRAAASPYATDGERGDEENFVDQFYELGDEGGAWFERARSTERKRRLESEFAMEFIQQFRGQLPFLKLLAELEAETARVQLKEATLREAGEEEREKRRRQADAKSEEAEAYYAAEAKYARGQDELVVEEEPAPASVAWNDTIAPRVVRQLVFAMDDADGVVVPNVSDQEDWSLRQGVARLDELLDAAGRGDLDAAMTLRRLAGLTQSLEELQVRRRGGSAAGSQRDFEDERRRLVEQMAACVVEPEEDPPDA